MAKFYVGSSTFTTFYRRGRFKLTIDSAPSSSSPSFTTMAIGRFFHYIGTLCLAAAVGLLIVTTVTAPTTRLSLCSVSNNQREIIFGTFGYCSHQVGSSDYACSGVDIGYAPDAAIRSIYANVQVNDLARDALASLTKVMVLHPVAAGLAGLAFLLSFATGFFTAFLATLTSGLAFCAALAVLVVDFVNFAAIRRAVDDDSDGRLRADYQIGSWTLLAGTALLVPATILLMLTCCSGRRERRGYFPKSV